MKEPRPDQDPFGTLPPTPPPDEREDQTAHILEFLQTAHGATRVDDKGDWFYDTVSAISIHLLLKSRLPGPPLLWAWYGYFDRQRGESIYQSLTPQQDPQILEILGETGLRYNEESLRRSGLLFLESERRLVYDLLADFLLMRLDEVETQTEDRLTQMLTPKDTWSEKHLARVVHTLQTAPLGSLQRQAVYQEFSTGYQKATARHLMDMAATEPFWIEPPPPFDRVERRLISLARFLGQKAHRLGVYVSKMDYEGNTRRRTWENPRKAGRHRTGTRGITLEQEAHFLTLGLPPGASLSQVKNAYRQKVKQHHPDQGGTVQDFLSLQEAYELLLTQVYRSDREEE